MSANRLDAGTRTALSDRRASVAILGIALSVVVGWCCVWGPLAAIGSPWVRQENAVPVIASLTVCGCFAIVGVLCLAMWWPRAPTYLLGFLFAFQFVGGFWGDS